MSVDTAAQNGVPPVIPPDTTEHGLRPPAHEWAQTTTNALRDPDTVGNASSMNPTTAQMLAESPSNKGNLGVTGAPILARAPSNEPPIPGAYHPDDAESRQQPGGSGSMFAAGTGMAASAGAAVGAGVAVLKEKVTDAATVVGQTAMQVVDTVQGYMPVTQRRMSQASEHDIPHVVSLPSQELLGNQPGERVGGVGSLPGPITETGVAELPDERNQEEWDLKRTKDTSLPSAGRSGSQPVAHSGGVARLPEDKPDLGGFKAAGMGMTTVAGAGGDLGTSHTISPTTGRGIHLQQVRSYGADSETLSPESEYSQPSMKSQQQQRQPQQETVFPGGGFGGMPRQEASKPEQRAKEGLMKETDVTSGGGEHKAEPRQKQTHPPAEKRQPQLHAQPQQQKPLTGMKLDTSGDTQRVEPMTQAGGVTHPQMEEPPSPTKPGQESKRKLGFMEKMKGEAKVLFGKVEGGKKGEEKVEEGKKILGSGKTEAVSANVGGKTETGTGRVDTAGRA